MGKAAFQHLHSTVMVQGRTCLWNVMINNYDKELLS